MVLRFYHGRGYPTLLSHRKLKETIFDAKYIQLVDFSPSTVQFCVSSDLVECETNTRFGSLMDYLLEEWVMTFQSSRQASR